MKKIFYLKTAILSLAATALLSSCLKDPRYVNFGAAGTLIEFPLAEVGDQAGIGGPFQIVSYPITTTPQVLKVAVHVAAAKPLSTPLTVTVIVDQAALNTYNTNNGTAYTLLPAADYTSSLTVTIPANTSLAYMNVNINTSLIDPSQSYVLPLTISSAGGEPIAQPEKTLLYNVGVKNAYDANYTETGYKFHPAAPHALTGTIAVTTVSLVTSQTAVGDLGGNGYLFDFDTNGSTLSNWVPEVNTPAAPASGFMTVDVPVPAGQSATYYAAAAPNMPGTAPYISATYNNSYDATNQIFWMHYGYGVGTTSQLSYTRQFYVELVRNP